MVERYFREVEAASSSLVIPIYKTAEIRKVSVVFLCISVVDMKEKRNYS